MTSAYRAFVAAWHSGIPQPGYYFADRRRQHPDESSGELQTIIHHKMPIKIFLINNGGYHSIRQTQKNFFGEPLVGIGEDSHDLSFPDMEKLAWAYGYPYVRACSNRLVGEAVVDAGLEGPVICEVFVSNRSEF